MTNRFDGITMGPIGVDMHPLPSATSYGAHSPISALIVGNLAGADEMPAEEATREPIG